MNPSPGNVSAGSSLEAGGAIELDAADLPAFCPNPRMPIWSSHPRVFLDVSHGETRCPYCGTAYRLKPGVVVKSH